MDIRGYTDLYGNPCLRTVLPAGRSSFRYQAVAVVPDQPRRWTRMRRSARPTPSPTTP